MGNLHSVDDFKANPNLAIPAIAKLLKNGQLSLFLGAGASQGFGLPSWTELIARIVGKGDDAAYIESLKSKSDRDLGRLIDPFDVEPKSKYLDEVKKALYQGVDDNLIKQLLKSPLLLSVTALMTGSSRGRIKTVFSYNYDDLLKRYLEFLGYSVCQRNSPIELTRRADVEINYPHGFLAQYAPPDPTTELVLSAKSYTSKRTQIDEGWSSYIEHSLQPRGGLFLGLSGEDTSIGLLPESRTVVKCSSGSETRRTEHHEKEQTQ